VWFFEWLKGIEDLVSMQDNVDRGSCEANDGDETEDQSSGHGEEDGPVGHW
jgi:hypothetical protein